MKNMMIKTIFFDLDGTLLPMEQDFFTKEYFKALAAFLAPHGYEQKSLINGIWAGTEAMVKNDGQACNEKVFWQTFAGFFSKEVFNDIPLFETFYQTDFAKAKKFCGYDVNASKAVVALKEKGYNLVLASQPVFPLVAQETRLLWAGIDADKFDYISSYENSSYSKPNPGYYVEICEKLSLNAEECLMVGNDLREDGAATKIGMSFFVLDNCVINKDNAEIEIYPHGDFFALQAYLEEHNA